MPLNFLESAHYKLKALTGKNPVHEIGTGFADLAEGIDALLWERLLNLSEKATSGATTTGQLVKCTAAITVTSPAAAISATFGVLANGHAVTIKAATGKIFGDFLAEGGVTECNLVGYQHLVLTSDGTNWFIIAGEPKRESAWTAMTSAFSGTPSLTRPATVALTVGGLRGTAQFYGVTVGGVAILASSTAQSATESGPFQTNQVFPVPAGQTWEVPFGWFGITSCQESHLLG